MDGDRAVDRRPPASGEPHARPAAVVGVGAALDETGLDEPVEPLGHAARREHRRAHQLGRAELERRPRTPERREEIEPPRLEPAAGETRCQPGIGELRGTQEPSNERQCAGIEVGSFPAPLLDDPVDAIHLQQYTSRKETS